MTAKKEKLTLYLDARPLRVLGGRPDTKSVRCLLEFFARQVEEAGGYLERSFDAREWEFLRWVLKPLCAYPEGLKSDLEYLVKCRVEGGGEVEKAALLVWGERWEEPWKALRSKTDRLTGMQAYALLLAVRHRWILRLDAEIGPEWWKVADRTRGLESAGVENVSGE